MGMGWVPVCVQGVEWTTPALISGYLATRSWTGALLQIVNIALGVGIYAPFVLLYDKMLIRQSQRQMSELIETLDAQMEQGKPAESDRDAWRRWQFRKAAGGGD